MTAMATITRLDGHSFRGSHAERPRAPRFPRLPLYTAIGFVMFSLGAILFGSVSGIGTLKVEQGRAIAVRDIRIAVEPDETIRVSDARSQKEIAVFAPDQGGFVRGSLRAFNRMRFVDSVSESAPYRVIRWENGSVSLSDTGTGERFHLNAFGRDNAEAFAAFLEGYGTKGGSR